LNKNVKIQANLKFSTVERIQKINGRPATRGFDKEINEALDNLLGTIRGDLPPHNPPFKIKSGQTKKFSVRGFT